MIVDEANLVSKIALERPASVRRILPSVGDKGWLLPDYVVGPENNALRFLFNEATVQQLAAQSPVVFYGERGTGKTALSITLGVRWSRTTGRRPLTFASGASFASEYAEAVEIDDIGSFRKRFRECQLLVLDDVEALAQKTAACHELAHTLDVLVEAKRPAILTISRLPTTIRGLPSSLASRLTAGLSIPLHRPGEQTCQEIVRSLIAQFDPALPADPVVTFCTGFASSPLRAEDLARLVTIASQNRSPDGDVDFRVVGQLATQLFTGEGPTIASIAKVVARKMHVRLLEMRGATREASIVRARGLAILLSRKLTSASLQQIGEFFGGRDHSTILHACRKSEKLLASDSELATLHQEVQSELLR